MKGREMNVLLTGATGGIGTQTAALLATRGANLLLCARLVNNAGVNGFNGLDRQSDSDLEAVINTNLLAPMLLTQKLLPLLRQREKAIVLNVGSIVGSIGMPGQVAYCSSKFGMHGFSEALRRELQGTSVRVLYVAPRSTDTDMNDPLMRKMNELAGVSTDDSSAVARHIVDSILASRRERFIGWPERLFVKINALLPGLVDRSLRKQARLLEPAPAHNEPQTISHGVK